jgi:hypothetical protein
MIATPSNTTNHSTWEACRHCTGQQEALSAVQEEATQKDIMGACSTQSLCWLAKHYLHARSTHCSSKPPDQYAHRQANFYALLLLVAGLRHHIMR